MCNPNGRRFNHVITRRLESRRFLIFPKMRHGVLFSLGSVALAIDLAAQSAGDVARPQERRGAGTSPDPTNERRRAKPSSKSRKSARSRQASSNFVVSKRSLKKSYAWH